jgi:L-malate glycosyltransferase
MALPKKNILFIHLLNDFSGSPSVLAQAINALPNEQYHKTLIVSSAGEGGFLSDLKNVETKLYWYKWHASNWKRLITYSISQIHLFLLVLTYYKKDVIIYINTLLPFGAGLAATLIRKKVIYHVHETTVKPHMLKLFLMGVANLSSKKIIYVSHYLKDVLKLKNAGTVVHNCLSTSFITTASFKIKNATPKNIVMICSLKKYKGVYEFIELAAQLPFYPFELVLNAGETEVNELKKSIPIPNNLSIHPAQKNVHAFYKSAFIVLNLSHPTTWIETFGMTLLEAMQYGIPVIAPTLGGPVELITDGMNGYLASVDELEKIKELISSLKNNEQLYKRLSASALEKASEFSPTLFSGKIAHAVESL